MVYLYSEQDVIKKFMKSLDNTTLNGEEALDEAVRACSSFSSIKDVINNMISDCRNASSATDFLKNKCNIYLDNDDTGAITGADAGGSVIKTAESVVPENGAASYPSGDSFTMRGLKVKIPKKNTLTTDQQIVVQGLYSWWIEEALKLIEESYGSNYTFSNHTIYIKFYNDTSDHAAARGGSSSVRFNMLHWNNIVDGDPNSLHIDTTVAHELTHSIMYTNINSFGTLPAFIQEGMAELTGGADYGSESAVRNYSSLKKNLNLNLKYDTNENWNDYIKSYSTGYVFLRYLAKQGAGIVDSAEEEAKYSIVDLTSEDDSVCFFASKATLNANDGNDTLSTYDDISFSVINGGNGNDNISNFASNITINGDAGNDTILNKSSNVVINGGDDDDYINNMDSNVKIYAGAGNDTIVNLSSKITINSGTGNDSIMNYSEKVIVNSGSGNDSIYNNAAYVTIDAGEGNNTIKNESLSFAP